MDLIYHINSSHCTLKVTYCWEDRSKCQSSQSLQPERTGKNMCVKLSLNLFILIIYYINIINFNLINLSISIVFFKIKYIKIRKYCISSVFYSACRSGLVILSDSVVSDDVDWYTLYFELLLNESWWWMVIGLKLFHWTLLKVKTDILK